MPSFFWRAPLARQQRDAPFPGEDGAAREVLRPPRVIEEDAVGGLEEHLVAIGQLVLPFQMPAVGNTVVPQDHRLGVARLALFAEQRDKVAQKLDVLNVNLILNIDEPACDGGGMRA